MTNKHQYAPVVWVTIFSVIYIAIPYWLFFLGWLTAWISIAMSVLLLISFYAIYYECKIHQTIAVKEPIHKLTLKKLFIILLASSFLISISGIGGYGAEGGDWEKHRTILEDLIEFPWPVSYDIYGQPVALVYYIAYYLPAALIGKLTTIQIAYHSIALWSLVGLVLTICWFHILSKQHSILLSLACFVFLSGFDWVGFLLNRCFVLSFLPRTGEPFECSFQLVTHFDHWAEIWKYNSNIISLYWAPHQALSGWIVTGLIIFNLRNGSRKNLIFHLALTALWSPFITLGIGVYIFADFIRHFKFKSQIFWGYLWQYLSITNFTGLLTLFMIGIYYITKLEPIIPLLDESFRSGFIFDTAQSIPALSKEITLLILFYSIELIGFIFAIQFFAVDKRESSDKWFYIVSMLSLLLIPMYAFGKYNDFSMRVSIPSLFIVGTLFTYYFSKAFEYKKYQIFYLAILICGAITPLWPIGHHTIRTIEKGMAYEFSAKSRSLVERYAVDFQIIRQYVSNSDTLFFNYLAKPLSNSDDFADTMHVLYNDQIVLFEHTLGSHQTDLGMQLDLLLKLRAIKDIDKNYTLTTRLLSSDNRVVWEQQDWPVGRATSEWEASRDFWYDYRKISVPASAGIYRLDMYFADSDQNKLPAFTLPLGNFLGEIVYLDYVTVGPKISHIENRLRDIVDYGQYFRLIGRSLPLQKIHAKNDTINIDVTWQTLKRPDKNYTTFVHLLDLDGNLITQTDRLPLDGFIPTSMWRTGSTKHDSYHLIIPESIEPADYKLVIGFYDLISGERLSVTVNGKIIDDMYLFDELTIYD